MYLEALNLVYFGGIEKIGRILRCFGNFFAFYSYLGRASLIFITIFEGYKFEGLVLQEISFVFNLTESSSLILSNAFQLFSFQGLVKKGLHFAQRFLKAFDIISAVIVDKRRYTR